ncbi:MULTISPECIES: gamma-glutamyl-gamma-aminobutyrate hydrolase family protein [unclassified Microbacterium]|uniref:anthranilate synthase component II n=1 Tax=unclassified Microbacterium TaxID=2609290 RepID=UPI00214B9214|nr:MULTISPECIES: gamma-glutamyl-gamma-aminobutyrate hydrolase family protein [unclassified Microbacterium]MCR2783044.1 gamma-glutamyl-gamma-aminobutyrate hydrolase family protein [Microbacterium sp. zg.B96]MDL5352184.1 gamma-glutamyl-gamma-aminobutyrate hydrolase family protein [Microbacterium sp. zg-YB36]WIM16070.1 gamma-glutamyl-gamma-aminobutyrate hydrolase family protein [Microbacterium sp. zg-B96]
MTRVLVVDNHDSFVHTLVGYLGELGAMASVVEADEIIDPAAAIAGYDGVLISPGPGTPARAGASIAVVHAAAERRMPLLGVCLGHQAIGEAFGATVTHAPELMHGMTSDVHHDGGPLYAGLPAPFVAGRYHSLAIVAGTLPAELIVAARTETGVVMGVTHRTLPIDGVQFHPESVLTEGGYRLLGNWLERVGVGGAAARGSQLRPHRGGAGYSPVQ